MKKYNKKQTRMIGMASSMENYWNEYFSQPGYEDYTVKTFIDDALYGLGIAIDPEKYFAAQGYDKFKLVLLEHLTGEKQ